MIRRVLTKGKRVTADNVPAKTTFYFRTTTIGSKGGNVNTRILKYLIYSAFIFSE